MADTIDDYVYEERVKANSSKAGKVARGMGKGFYYGVGMPLYFLTVKPTVAAFNSVKSRHFNVYPGQVAVSTGNYRMADEANLSIIEGLLSSGYGLEEVYKENPSLFAKGVKILGPKRKPLFRPFGAYFKLPGKDIVIIDTKSRIIDPEKKGVTSSFGDAIINFDVDVKVTYQDDPFYFFQIHGGQLIQIRDLRDKEPEEDNLGRLIKLRSDLEDRIYSFASGVVTRHFNNYDLITAVKTPIVPTRTDSDRRNLQKNLGVKINPFDVEEYSFSRDQQELMYKVLVLKQLKSQENRRALNDFKETINTLSDIAKSSNFDDTVLRLLTQYNQFLRTTRLLTQNQERERINVYSPIENQERVDV